MKRDLKRTEKNIKFSIKDIDLYYGNLQALRSINLNIYEKCITAIIGPSGCGKSTFLHVLNRLNELKKDVRTTGTVEYNGIDIYRGYDVIDLRKRIGMVFQKPNPFPMSIYENIVHGPKVHGIRKRTRLQEISEWSLRQAALWDEVKDRLNESALSLSGGQQQRLCIARTIAVEPDVILLDESTSSLDPISTSKIEELVDQLSDRYTIIMVTHNLQQAARISDYTAFIFSGELIEYGNTEELFFRPKTEQTEDYIAGKFG